MLLFCCFGGSKKNHKKKNWENDKERGSEESDELSNRLISTPIISTTFTSPLNNSKIKVDLQDNTLCLKRQQSSGEEIKLNNKREELEIQRRNVPAYTNCDSTPVSKEPHNQNNSPTFTKFSFIQSRKEQSLVPRDVSRIFASAQDLKRSNLSIFNIHKAFKTSTRSMITSSSQPTNDDLILNNQPSNQNIVKEGDDKCKSNFLNEEGLIPEQKVNEEEREKEKEEKNKGVLEDIREETEKKIDALKTKHLIELEKVRETLDVKLLEEKENHRKDLEKATTYAKNATNEKIDKLNKQIVLERGKLFAEQQENSKHLEEDFRMKEDRLNQSLKQVEEREQSWEDERADILREVQRLKLEATRMVNILAMEYEEENSSEDKKRSLSQEVYSLQLVVEMRTGEKRTLREQLARATQELEQAEIVKEKLGKSTLRIEDLEEQINIKNLLEKKLSVEKCQLEINISNTSKTADRMSKDVESLQWRIRNNFDLPVDNLTPLTSEQQEQDQKRSSLPAYFAAQQINYTDSITTCLQSMNLNHKKLESNQRKTLNVKESDEIIKADISDKAVTSGFSDDFCSSFSNYKQINKENINFTEPNHDCSNSDKNEIKVNDLDTDIDSLDEGVGDISLDGEHQ